MNLQRIIIGLLILVVFIQYCTSAEAQIDLKDEYMDMVILLDRSGSMISTDPEGLSVAAASFIIDQLSLTNEKNRVAVVPFSSNAYILGQEKPNPQAALTHYPAALIEMMTAGISNAGEFTFRENSPDNPTAFYNLLRGQMQERGYTELGKALDLAKEILANGRPEARKVILLISDGIPEPDISSEARLNELSHIVGNDLIRKIKQKRLQTDIQNLNKRFAEYLLNNIVSDLAREGISIYPVAFHMRGEESLALVEYLKQIKKATIGEEEIISVDADTLISELVGFIPSGANHIRLRNIKGFITGAPSSKTFNITIPEIALQTRFFFSYKGTRKSHKPRVKIYIGNTPLADTESPERFDAVTFNSLRKRDGSIVYHSFRIENLVVSEANLSEKAKESLRIEVIDSSTGGVEGLPDTDLFIDIRSSLYPEIEVIPETLTATASIEMRFKLFAEVKNEVKVIDITGADIFIIGKEPEDIKEISYKMRNVRYEGGMPFQI